MSFNVLLVDDSATTRSVIAKTFKLADLPINELHEAGDGQEALRILNSQWIDVVFADLNMPTMDGAQLVEHMAADRMLHNIPVVLVTIEGSVRRIDELKTRGVAAFIRKPFTPEAIRDVFGKVMRPQIQSVDRSLVADVFCKVMEGYAFMLGSPVEKKDFPGPGEGGAKQATVYFSGRLSGHVAVVVPQRMCPLLAANVLGVEPGDASAVSRADDSLKELANVAAGQVMTAVAGEDIVLERSLPELAGLDGEGWAQLLAEEETIPFIVDEYPILLQVKAEGGRR